MARERREHDRAGTSRALGVLFVVLPYPLVQFALAVLALLAAFPRPRWSIRLAALAAVVSLVFLVGDGWHAAGCTIG